ncbi:MAG TPA: putative zinc-binding protein [Anaerohalosphaeraceae bacterium]|nr:putative zinc-binding protein [Anaerohalosphaeraceae bacterium]HOL88863.1 putative zinc-binding protein [Anaerohalosphaeraceae bacterium]HPP55705.1 putative zinc-binding protein [Anaerohalosphaeraceae bacterium]
MTSGNSCACSGGTTLIFACSGAADVGAIADRAARKMTQMGLGKMFCTVGIGGRISGILKTTEAAEKILAVDGCPLNCVKQSLELAGFKKFRHLQLADLGMEKGKTPVSDEAVEKVAAKGKELLAG